jgi:hypothetical protein
MRRVVEFTPRCSNKWMDEKLSGLTAEHQKLSQSNL